MLLKLDIERAEYWDPDGGRPRIVYASRLDEEADTTRRV